MTTNNIWDCAEMPPMFSAKWSPVGAETIVAVFFSFFFCIFGMQVYTCDNYCFQNKNFCHNYILNKNVFVL
jgi:hypothetical protein